MDVNVLCMNDTQFDPFACNHSAQRMDKVWSCETYFTHCPQFPIKSPGPLLTRVPGEWCLTDGQFSALSCNPSWTLYPVFISFSMVFGEVRASFPLYIKPSSCNHCSCPQLQLHFSYAVRGVISTQFFYQQCSEGVRVYL